MFSMLLLAIAAPCWLGTYCFDFIVLYDTELQRNFDNSLLKMDVDNVNSVEYHGSATIRIVVYICVYTQIPNWTRRISYR